MNSGAESSQLVVILISLAILVLDILFVYLPVQGIQSKIRAAVNVTDSVAMKISNLTTTFEPQVDQLIQETANLENRINMLFQTVTTNMADIVTEINGFFDAQTSIYNSIHQFYTNLPASGVQLGQNYRC